MLSIRFIGVKIPMTTLEDTALSQLNQLLETTLQPLIPKDVQSKLLVLPQQVKSGGIGQYTALNPHKTDYLQSLQLLTQISLILTLKTPSLEQSIDLTTQISQFLLTASRRQKGILQLRLSPDIKPDQKGVTLNFTILYEYSHSLTETTGMIQKDKISIQQTLH